MTMEPTDGFNPYAPPESPLEETESLHEALRPVPWEDLEAFPGFWQRVGGMFKLAFTAPVELIGRVPMGSGFGAPWRFVMVLAIPVLAIMALILGVMALVGVFAGEKDFPTWVFPLMFIAALIVAPLMYFLQMFLWGAVNHACLWMWGALKEGESLEQTLRATGYAQGFLVLGGMIPLLNYAVMAVIPAVLGMGLARMHRTETWRGVCAAYTPALFCCCAYAALILGAMGMGALRPGS